MRIGLPALRNIQSLIRHFSSSPVCAVDKSALSTLRKNTGYTFTNCKKALDQFGDDLVAAEKWLRDQAQKEGWAKATKLQDRVVSQGLIGVKCNAEDGTGVLLEVNCETDFVARNVKFQELLASVAEACSKELQLKAIDGASYHKWSITPELLSSFKASHDKTLGDLTALSIGTLGENIVLKRALLVKANPKECKIGGYAHSSDNTAALSGCTFGRYAALAIYRLLPGSLEKAQEETCSGVPEPTEPLSPEDLGRQLCQHIVGMSPKSIGQPGEAQYVSPKVEEPAPAAVDESREEDGGDSGASIPTRKVAADDESRLIYQEFLSDNTVTVQEVLQRHHAEVLDFVRFELGGGTQEAEPSTSQ